VRLRLYKRCCLGILEIVRRFRGSLVTFRKSGGMVGRGNSLNIESTGDTTTELQFRGEGSFVGWNGVSLNRDRGTSNSTEPSEEFVFRSDLMINAPIALKFSRYVWQEKAPN